MTGSRLARPDLESASPITVITPAQIEAHAASANIENVLNDLPQFTATSTSTSNNPGGGAVTANLRNLGGQRTLVLVDGMRYMSFDVTQQVDLNTIPTALIQRVDVLTGGASAVYGSDAIAGVVNFVLKQNFEGVEANSSYNVTGQGDGQLFDVNATIGTNTSDGRGNITVYGDYSKRKGTFAGARAFSTPPYYDLEDGSPYILAGSGSIPNGRINISGLGAATGSAASDTCSNPNNQAFNAAGALHCYNALTDSYNYNPVNYLQIPQERYQFYAQAHYDVNDNFKPYLIGTFAYNRVPQQLAATPISNATPYGTSGGSIPGLNLQVNSPFFSPATQTALQALDATQSNAALGEIPNDGYVFAPSFGFRSVQAGPRIETDERNAFRIVAGAKGDIAAGFKYDAYYMYSRTTNSQEQAGNININNFLNATETAFNSSGQLVCRSATAQSQGCVPANIFGFGNLSQAAINYITFNAINSEHYSTQVASFVVSNPNIYDLGAGPIGVDAGFEYRHEQGSVVPDSLLASGLVAGFNSGEPTSGSYDLKEYFAEFDAPLLSDHIVHKLEVNGAARYSQYSNNVGNVFTWAAGVQLSPIKGITLRGDYQKAVRAPSVNELYLGNTVSFAGNADGCAVAAATAPGTLHDICVSQFNAAGAPLALIGNPAIADSTVNPPTDIHGNPNLTAETAHTYTLGAIIQPVRNLSITVDYYHINISHFIIPNLSTSTISNLCYNSNISTYCNLITRNSSGEIVSFASEDENSGGLQTRGIDVTAGYSLPLGEFRGQNLKASFSFDGSYLLKYNIQPVVGQPENDHCAGGFGQEGVCGVPTPHWRHAAHATLGVGDESLTFGWRYIGPSHDVNADQSIFYVEHIKAVNYFDLTATADVGEHFALNIGVSNLTDKQPPIIAALQQGGNGEQSNTFPTLYDVLGRTFFVSGKVKF